MGIINLLHECTGFEWDAHNTEKNWQKHRVTPSECEQIFFNRPLVAADDEQHSLKETRLYALGQTDAGRLLFIVFTVRLDPHTGNIGKGHEPQGKKGVSIP